MKVKRRHHMFSLIELAATLQEMPGDLPVWMEGVGESYCWGSLKEFRESAAEMLAYDRPVYPALVRIDGRIHPISGIEVHGNRIVLQALPELPTPDMSRVDRALLPV